MGKIGIIIWREYLTRVKNKTFILMCFILPLMVGGMIFITQRLEAENGIPRTVVVVDASGCPDTVGYAYIFKDTMDMRFNYDHVYQDWESVKKMYRDSSHVSVLYIPENFMGGCDSTQDHSSGIGVKLISTSEPGNDDINLLEAIMTREMQKNMMEVSHISQKSIDLALKKVSVADEVNGTTQGDIKAIVGLAFGFVIYMYILMFGVQIMRSVVEEKMTRIVEVIISSVKPFQLMLGKIIGVTMVGITQFLIWIILSGVIVVPVINSVNDSNLDYTKAMPSQIKTAMPVNTSKGLFSIDPTQKTKDVVATIEEIPWGNLIPAFLFYFLFGYFLYASIFAAIGSAADVDADTQQFTFPVTIPLIISMISCVTVLNDPNGHTAKLLSMIPFTSPIVMLLRIPFGGVAISELLLSFAILIATFLFFTWVSGRIYRVGILMYGKKATWKELGKWIFYKV
ncbi:MAG TPA: ABC transporter permease [Bacteroidia bacterium]|nr:ABC transporter permease [Bacteroidia bacterium]